MMPGKEGEGANTLMSIRQLQPPVFEGDSITKESAVTVEVNVAAAMSLRVALMIRSYQEVESLELRSDSGELEVQAETDGAIADDATRAFGVPPDHKWRGFRVSWDPRHGTHVHSKIKLRGFDAPPRGFQMLAVVITDLGLRFTRDHYFVTASILPAREAPATELKLGS